jgi:hypothetical protein
MGLVDRIVVICWIYSCVIVFVVCRFQSALVLDTGSDVAIQDDTHLAMKSAG